MTTPPWLAPHVTRLATLAALAPAERVARLDAWASEAGLRTESGRTLRFVPTERTTPRRTAARLDYETRIAEAGEVAMRIDGPGARHDLLNALAWLAWPCTKARLNALHAREIAGASSATGATRACGAPRASDAPTHATAPARRGALRDAATLLDESGAVWVGLDASLEDALRAFDWQELFVHRRADTARAVRLLAVGHGLLEKLDAPYKAITAHAWPLRRPADAALADVDRALADALSSETLSAHAMCPLPVMGMPGWSDANADPAFYNDVAVFRAGRRHPARPSSTTAPHTGDTASCCSAASPTTSPAPRTSPTR